MGGLPLSIANTQQPGLSFPIPPSANTSTSATYTYSPTGLLSSETATTQTSPPSCPPPTPPAHPTPPPSQKPCSTTSTTSFSWNTASSIPEMIGVNGYAYIYAGGLPTEQIGPNGSVLYYLQDRQGSTVALTDSSGQVVARYSYSPYGTLTCGPNTPPNTQPNQPPCHPGPPTPPAACPPPSQHSPAGPPPCLSKAIAANHFLYDGQYLDTISGLYYLRARWYDPATGQFTSVDALVALTDQPYSYAGGNPVNGSDPSGLCTRFNWSCHWHNFLWAWQISSSSSGKVKLTKSQAENFLISNGWTRDNAKRAAESFTGTISMTFTANLSGPIYRYYGGTSQARGMFYTNYSGYAESQCTIRAALALQKTGNSAYWVTQVAANPWFNGEPLALEGEIAGSSNHSSQYVVYNPNEWVFGQGVPTGPGANPPPPPWWDTLPPIFF